MVWMRLMFRPLPQRSIGPHEHEHEHLHFTLTGSMAFGHSLQARRDIKSLHSCMRRSQDLACAWLLRFVSRTWSQGRETAIALFPQKIVWAGKHGRAGGHLGSLESATALGFHAHEVGVKREQLCA
jgi:hypothetical protein